MIKRTDLAVTGALTVLERTGWPVQVLLSLPITLDVSSGAPHSGAATLALTVEHTF